MVDTLASQAIPSPTNGVRCGMSSDEYKAALKRWGLKHKDAAAFFGFDLITSQRYAAGKRAVPPTLSIHIRLMIAMKLTTETVREWLAEYRPPIQ